MRQHHAELARSYNARVWALAACALLLLPGIMIVRAPWHLVPLLSVAFWVVAWSFTVVLPLAHSRLLGMALLASGTLALLRLLRLDGTRPAPATVAVAAAAALPLALLAVLPVGPGVWMPFHAAVARLLAWRDGVPVSYEPLLPFAHFVRAGFGLPALAADLTLLAGLSSARATLVVAMAGEGILVLALHALLAPRLSRAAAACLAVSVPALAHLGGVLPVSGSSPLVLALALACGALACFWNGTTRSSAVAGALMAVACVDVDPAAAFAAAPWLLVALFTSRRHPDPETRSRSDRARAAAVAGAVFGAPLLARAADVVATTRRSGGWEVLAGVGMLALTGLAVAAYTHVRAGRGDPSVSTKRSVLHVALVLALVGATVAQEWRRAEDALLAGPADLAALTWLQGGARREDVLCHGGLGALWAPGFSGAALRAPQLPPHIAARAGAPRPWRCTLFYLDRNAPAPDGEQAAFTHGPVRVFRVVPQPLTSFDSRRGNLLGHTP